MEKLYEVSIICNTYDQEPYLEKAVESMLAQRTSFDYEIIIHDDVSTDGTIDMIQKYVAAYPDKIRAVYEQENQYSKGADFITPAIRDIAKGKYIAMCEGDDFWIDENKLQLQRDALEAHPECDMCACWGCTVTEDGEREISQIRPRTGNGILSAKSVILGGGQYLVTAGLFFRRQMYENMLEFEKIISLDYAIQIKGSLRGGIFYIDKKMAVYRRYAAGSWTNDVLKNKAKLEAQWDIEKRLLETLDSDTDGKYHEIIAERMKAYIPFEQQMESRREDILLLMRKRGHPCYIWGMGRRGKSLECFFNRYHIKIDGICDAVNTDIGKMTEYGNKIFHTENVLKNAGVILASTKWAYEDLIKTDFAGDIVDFQQYMPYG